MVIASVAKQSNGALVDCFAALAMTKVRLNNALPLLFP